MARGSAWSAGHLLDASLQAAFELHQSEGEEGEPHAQPQRSRRGAGLPLFARQTQMTRGRKQRAAVADKRSYLILNERVSILRQAPGN